MPLCMVRDMQWPVALRLLPEEEMSWEPQWSAHIGWLGSSSFSRNRGTIQPSKLDGEPVSGQRLWIQVGRYYQECYLIVVLRYDMLVCVFNIELGSMPFFAPTGPLCMRNVIEDTSLRRRCGPVLDCSHKCGTVHLEVPN